jgi:hypothetical protein
LAVGLEQQHMQERFSDRHGYRGTEQEISIREDAPANLRAAVPLIAKAAGMTPTAMRRVICEVLLVRPDPDNRSDYPNVWGEVNGLIEECPWFKVYDIAEALHADLAFHFRDRAENFRDRLNQYFRGNGIGWQMTDGLIVYRGSEAFTDATREAVAVLTEVGRSAAANEIHEALQDISRRPTPDVTGAIQHAIAALECTARDVTGEVNLTLGRLVPKLKLVPPMDVAVEKLWGYASDRARHIREGHTVTTEEAELVVSVGCAVCTFLSRRSENGGASTSRDTRSLPRWQR